MTPLFRRLSVLVFLIAPYGLVAQAGAECDFNPDRVVVRFKEGSVSLGCPHSSDQRL
jgi:hypothetical protein